MKMVARTCEICGKTYSSGASYRTHKSLYHRKQAALEEGAQSQLAVESSVQQKQETTATDTAKEVDSKQDDENNKEGDDWGWIAAGLGLLAAIVIALLTGKGGNA
jgi:hypothetical protein